MSKILIAGIGGRKNKENGEYRKANYFIENEIYRDRSFITSAIEEHFNIDKTIYIGTVGSMWDNLYEHYTKRFNITPDENYNFYLLDKVDSANEETKIDEFNIEVFNNTFEDKVYGKITSYGMNENEILENFNIIMDLQDLINEGDEIYIDITHAFRSNAMWMFLVMNFITDLLDKNIEIKMISYGMFENPKRITKNDEEIKLTPVIDLNAFYKLQKWLKGAYSFKNYGNSYMIADMLSEDSKNLAEKLKNFSDAMNMNYIGSLKESIKSLKKLSSVIEEIEGPAKLLVPKIVKNFIKEFDGVEEEYLIQARLAKWHCSQKRYSLACINLNEAIIGFVADSLGFFDGKDKKDTARKKTKKWLLELNHKNKDSRFKNDKSNVKLLKYSKFFEHTRKMRNEMAHSIGEKTSASSDIKSIQKYCEDIEELLNDKKFINLKESELNIKNLLK